MRKDIFIIKSYLKINNNYKLKGLKTFFLQVHFPINFTQTKKEIINKAINYYYIFAS